MGRRMLLLPALVAAVLVLVSAGAALPASQPVSFGTATAIIVRLPGQEDLLAGAVTGPPRAFGVIDDFEYPVDSPVVSIRAAETDVHRSPGANESVQASTTIQEVSLFGGELEAAGLDLSAHAVSSRRGIVGSLAGSALERLSIGGELVPVTPNTRVELGDWGYAVVLEEAVLPQAAAGDGARSFVTGLHVYLLAPHGGLPSGTEILVGYAEAAIAAPLPPPPPAPPETTPSEATAPGLPLGNPTDPAPLVLNPPVDVRPASTGRGYVFPVYGAASFSNDFGAPRLTTGWHHGNDIFAPLGSPVLAVSNGTVYSVGWSAVGGWRLWLRDAQGNEYYYAHLSAYSPLAEGGGVVRAGDVLGFVGDSGDARGTPYHLHFEIHPAGLLGLGYDGVINPYEYLRAWHEHVDTGAVAALAAGPVPRPGALLLDVEDISTASGLEPGSLLRALGLVGEGTSLFLRPDPPSVLGAPPGFG